MRMSPSSCRQEAHGVFSVQLYDKIACRSIVERARRVSAWSLAAIGSETIAVVDPGIRSASSLDPKRTAAIHVDFECKVSETVLPLLRQIWQCDVARCEGTQLLRYGLGGHYLPHRDGDDSGYSSRYFTVVCYLNEDFDGGKTRFPSLGYCATPFIGRALIFPSRFTHCAEPVLSGEKFVFLTWLCGPVPIRWI